MFCGPHNNYCGTGAAPTYTSDVGIGMDTTGCNGRFYQSGTRTDYVDCPTTTIRQENYVVPRTVQGQRLETRTRTRTEMRQRVVPVTKYRTEMKMVPVSRQVAYQDYKTESYTRPVTENYNVRVPTSTVVNETRTRTRTIPGTKKCPVKVPVYTAKCNGLSGANAMSFDNGAPMSMPVRGNRRVEPAVTSTPLIGNTFATPAYDAPALAAPITSSGNMDNFTPYGKSS